MNIVIPDAFFDAADELLDVREARVYWHLVYRILESGRLTVYSRTLGRLASDTQVTPKNLNLALDKLVKLGLIRRVKFAKNEPWFFSLNLDSLPEKQRKVLMR